MYELPNDLSLRSYEMTKFQENLKTEQVQPTVQSPIYCPVSRQNKNIQSTRKKIEKRMSY